MRKIIVFEHSGPLESAYRQQDFTLAWESLSTPNVLSLTKFRTGYPPTRVPFGSGISAGIDPHDFEGSNGHGFAVSVDVVDELEADADTQLHQAFGPNIQIYRDPEIDIAAGATVSPAGSVGDLGGVTSALNLSNLAAHGHQGLGVRVAIVDGGIDGTQVNVSGGWSPYPGVFPGGGAAQSHGTMSIIQKYSVR